MWWDREKELLICPMRFTNHDYKLKHIGYLAEASHSRSVRKRVEFFWGRVG